MAVEGSGATLVVVLADRLRGHLGEVGRWAFLAGAWAAVFSSLLGVWQSVPYLFADLWRLSIKPDKSDGQLTANSTPYRAYMVALSILATGGLFFEFVTIQRLYAVVGALFIPMLALALLLLNGRARWARAPGEAVGITDEIAQKRKRIEGKRNVPEVLCATVRSTGAERGTKPLRPTFPVNSVGPLSFG